MPGRMLGCLWRPRARGLGVSAALLGCSSEGGTNLHLLPQNTLGVRILLLDIL